MSNFNSKKGSSSGSERESRSNSLLRSISRKILRKPSVIPTAQTTSQPALPDWLESWEKQLGKYNIDDTDKTLAELTKNEKARQSLYTDCVWPEAPTEARAAFIQSLAANENVKDLTAQQGFNSKTITMEELIGPAGIKLYEAACKEENNTKAFRDAVFISSSKTYEGPKWKDRQIIWVGGPSASGKSFGTDALINNIKDNLEKKENEVAETGNHVVSIDGGKEREMSQMRQLILQIALAKGYSGIEDLEKFSKNLKTKGHVKKAVLAHGKLNMVIPTTFTNPVGKVKSIRMMKKFEGEKETKQIFAQVRGLPSTDEFNGSNQFKQIVEKMGKSRAFRTALPADKLTKPINELIKPNNRDIGVESKSYNPNVFDLGVNQSNDMRKKFQKICKNTGSYYEITNDLVFIKPNESGGWEKCDQNDKFDTKGILRVREKTFQVLNEAGTEIKTPEEVKELDKKNFAPLIALNRHRDRKQQEDPNEEKISTINAMITAKTKVDLSLRATPIPAIATPSTVPEKTQSRKPLPPTRQRSKPLPKVPLKPPSTIPRIPEKLNIEDQMQKLGRLLAAGQNPSPPPPPPGQNPSLPPPPLAAGQDLSLLPPRLPPPPSENHSPKKK